MTGPVAAIDLGSNSTNLLIVDATGRDLERLVEVTGMARGADATPGRLAPEAFERVRETLRHYGQRLDAHGVDLPDRQVVATAAARALSDTGQEELFDLVARCVGVRPRLVSAMEEGRLAFGGAVHALHGAPPPWLMVDIGGASTELMWGHGEAELGLSIDVGAVTLTTRELHSDPPRPEELSNAVGAAADAVADAVRAWPTEAREATLVGVAGTVVTTAAVEIGLADFDATALHGFVLTRDAAEDVFRTLATESLADRVHNPGLPANRADVIVGGLCILVAVMRTLRAPNLVVSVHNLLDGVVADVLNRDR
jgi:exopolyphosphatase/guanosine-5'-triphosphate,3'-diphosphate pyrophosphatase